MKTLFLNSRKLQMTMITQKNFVELFTLEDIKCSIKTSIFSKMYLKDPQVIRAQMTKCFFFQVFIKFVKESLINLKHF